MRFVPDGPDVPDELIAYQEKGEILFICGAGVSKSIGLPTFRGLVEEVYKEIGEDWMPHPAEREVMIDGGSMAGQYDRCLRALERRLIGANQVRSRGMRERLRAAVKKSLTVPSDQEHDLSNHAALIGLSRDDRGNMRLVTTNFDTLFERAWTEGKAPSFAGAAMPQPKTADCNGILHLHGRLADEKLNLEDTALVLTSAEFGDAYLRAGWASRYVYDLVRAYVVVLVGYSADDPPMRYLLEVLESDRERYPDLRKVYAFAAIDKGDEGLTTALWSAKGVEAILHPASDEGYASLYESIKEWQRYADNPTDWRRVHLRNCFKKTAGESDQDEITNTVHLLRHGDAGQLITELSPSPDWLGVFEQSKIFADGRSTPAIWIAQNIDNADMIRACARLSTFDPYTVWQIQHAIEVNDATLPLHRKRAWEIILEARLARADGEIDVAWHGLVAAIRAGRADYAARRTICQMLRPRLKVERPFTFFDDEDKTEKPETLFSLVWVEFETAAHTPPSEILSAWPHTDKAEIDLLQMLERTLADALELAESVNFAGSWDRTDHDVPSVAPHGQNQYRRGFYPSVRLIADLWQRLANHNPAMAKPLPLRWLSSPFLLFKRLALFAFTTPTFSANQGAEAVLGLTDDDFWLSGASVEIMKFLTDRWLEMPPDLRTPIEDRISAGIPLVLFEERPDWDEEKQIAIAENAIFKRLKRLELAGIVLSTDSQTKLQAIVGRHPIWLASAGDRDDFHSWSESSSGPDGHAELLSNTDDEQIVQEAMRIQNEQRKDEGDLWRVFCSADPQRALRGLRSEAEKGNWEDYTWRMLFWAAEEKEDLALHQALATSVLATPDMPLQALLGTVTTWLRRKRKLIWGEAGSDEAGKTFFAIWDRCAGLTYSPGAVAGKIDYDDIATRALNDPGGELVWALIESLSDAAVTKRSGLLPEYRSRFEAAIASPTFQGLLARYQCAGQIIFLNGLDPEWAQAHVLPTFDWTQSEALYMWAAFARADERVGPSVLFNALKPNLLIAASRPDLPGHVVENLASRLFTLVIWRQNGGGQAYDFSNTELRRLLTVAPESVRNTLSWRLWRLIDADIQLDGRANQWRNLVGPIFSSIWPLDSRLRTAQISQNFVMMALASREAFPEAINAIADTLVPYRLHSVKSSLRFDDKDKAEPLQYPAAFLKTLDCLIDPTEFQPPRDLAEVLEQIVVADPALKTTSSYRRLLAIARASDA